MDEVDKIRRFGSALEKLRNGDSEPWENPVPADIINSDRIIILIHGFTSHGMVLEALGKTLNTWFNKSLILFFNYDSLTGIHIAANSLVQKLLNLNIFTKGALQQKKIYLIAHSMGGLVARCLLINSSIRLWIKSIIMLGTPNNGALSHKKMIDFMIDYGEHITGSVFARNPMGLSAKQLTKTDSLSGSCLIDQINYKWLYSDDYPPTLTISGGLKELEIGKNIFYNRIFNLLIQLIMNGQDNDGLIAENSVCMSQFIHSSIAHTYRHYNTYSEYHRINHTYLVKNNDVHYTIIRWIMCVEMGNLAKF